MSHWLRRISQRTNSAKHLKGGRECRFRGTIRVKNRNRPVFNLPRR